MLTLVTGPNGSGKSQFAMRLIVEELRKGTRYIVTSVCVKLPELSEYMSRKFPSEKVDVYSRVFVLTEMEQLRHFWRYTGPFKWGEYGAEAVDLGEYGGAAWQAYVPPTLYVLEELQVTFNSRDWAKTAKEFTAFQTQHRHFGHDVVGITPALALVEKQFRILCGECVVLRNLYQARAGIWKHSRKIIYRKYANAPPLPGEAPTEAGDFTIDILGLANCYDTSGGIGHAAGRVADKGKESKGIPWKWGIAAAVVAGVVVFFGMRQVLHGAAGYGKAKWLTHPGATVAGSGKSAEPVSVQTDQDQRRADAYGKVVEGLKAYVREHSRASGGVGSELRYAPIEEVNTNLPVLVAYGGLTRKGAKEGSWVLVCESGRKFQGSEVLEVPQGLRVDGTLYRYEPRSDVQGVAKGVPDRSDTVRAGGGGGAIDGKRRPGALAAWPKAGR